MQSGLAPGTAISAAHRSGTAPNPISRMAVAGNVLVTYAVPVKLIQKMSASTRPIVVIRSCMSAWERSVTWDTVSSSTVVAPRNPLTVGAGAMAGHSTGMDRDARLTRSDYA